MRTTKSVELRKDGWLFEKSNKENVIGANKVAPGKELSHIFDFLSFSSEVIFEDILKMLKNYPKFQDLNPFMENILNEYEEVRDIKPATPSSYNILLFEKHVIDSIDKYSEDSGFFGYSLSDEAMRYEVFYENLEDLLKYPVQISNIINTYMDEENGILDASAFEFYTCDLSTLIKTLVYTLQEAGTREEKILEKEKFTAEYGEEKTRSNIKLSVVSKGDAKK